MARLSHGGLSIEMARGWDGEMHDRFLVDRDGPPTGDDGELRAAAQSPALGTMHVANFPLPPVRGDYGSGAVELMGTESVFIAILEMGPENANTALFAQQGLPLPVLPEWFSPSQLQRPQAQQVGHQAFFSVGDRSFVVYVVLGDGRRASQLAADANELLATVRFD